jgi:hypothetical protein
MTVIYKKDTGRITVGEAKRLIVAAMPDDGPSWMTFYATSIGPDGEPEWDIDNPTPQSHREASETALNNRFPDLCKQLGFEPRLSYDPTTKGYRPTDSYDRFYMITHAQFLLIAAEYGLTVEIGVEPSGQAPQNTQTHDKDQADTSRPSWSIRTDLQRLPGYRNEVYKALKAIHARGDLRPPKPRELIEYWEKNTPFDIALMPDGVKYTDAKGMPKEANLNAIKKVIGGLLGTGKRASGN